MKIDKKQYFKHGIFLLILFSAAFLVYGNKISEMGFYWDDLPNTFFEANGGADDVMRTVATGRPAMSILFYLPSRLFGENPIVWQIYSIISRVILTIAMYGFLQTLWPNRINDNQRISLLILVYPGFKQIWISKIYPQIFIVFILEFLSLIIFIIGLRKSKHRYLFTISSVLLSFYCLNASEYVFCLEFMRPAIIVFEEWKNNENNNLRYVIWAAFSKWIPYLLSLVAFIFYRTFWANSGLYSVTRVEALLNNPMETLSDLFHFLYISALSSIFSAWGAVFTSFRFDQFSRINFYSILALLCLCLFCLLLQSKFRYNNLSKHQKKSSWQQYLLSISFSSLILAGVPFWAAHLTPALDFPNDRFYLSYMFGSAAIVYLILSLFKKWPALYNLIFITIFCLSGFFHSQIAETYIDDWEYFTDFIQQLSWRVPSLEENTFLVAEELPFRYYSDNSLTGAVNWLYATEHIDENLPYMLNYTSVRLGRSLESLEVGQEIHQNYLLFKFDGSTEKMIVLYQNLGSCLHIANPELDYANPTLSLLMQDTATISNPAQIGKVLSQNDLFFLDDAADENWCYYYQKASLAFQYQDWKKAAELGNAAFLNGFHPNEASELIPFIAGYGFTGDWDRAVKLSLIYDKASNPYTPMICSVWNIIDNGTPKNFQKDYALGIINTELLCDFQ